MPGSAHVRSACPVSCTHRAVSYAGALDLTRRVRKSHVAAADPFPRAGPREPIELGLEGDLARFVHSKVFAQLPHKFLQRCDEFVPFAIHSCGENLRHESLAISIDDHERKPVMLLSFSGGSGIEARAGQVHRILFDVRDGPDPQALARTIETWRCDSRIT